MEVRPKELRGDIEAKLAAFRSETNQPIILLGEQFGRKLYRVFCWDISDSSAGCYDGYFGFAQAPCGAALLVSNDARLLNGSRTFYSNHELTQPINVFPLLWPCDVAAERAQSSRFEHGEQG